MQLTHHLIMQNVSKSLVHATRMCLFTIKFQNPMLHDKSIRWTRFSNSSPLISKSDIYIGSKSLALALRNTPTHHAQHLCSLFKIHRYNVTLALEVEVLLYN
jgi:hypothetical protein